MFKFSSTLDWSIFHLVTFIVADTDKDSAQKAEEFIKKQADAPAHTFTRIPRTREVGQSYLTSIFTTLRSLFFCIKVMFSTRPDLVRIGIYSLPSELAHEIGLRFLRTAPERAFPSVPLASSLRHGTKQRSLLNPN